MKMEIKSIRMLVIPALLFGCSGIHAQSSVTMYGIIDEGIGVTNNAAGKGSLVQFQNGYTYGSRWGIKGTEEIGGGTKIVFRLENGFNINTGGMSQPGDIFGRQAYIGVASDRYGTLTFGRQYDPTVDMFDEFTTGGNWAGVVGNVIFDNDNSNWDYRINNSVKYVTPKIGGFTGEAMYAFSNRIGFANNRVYSVAGRYEIGGLSAGAAYMKTDHPGSSASGAVGSDDSVFTGKSQQNLDVGLSYKWDKVYLAGAWSHTKVGYPTGTAYLPEGVTPANGGTWTGWTFDNFQINGQYYFTPALWGGAAYMYTIGHLDTTVGNYEPKWHYGALMLHYALSKRTSVYAQAGYQHVASAHTGTGFDKASIIGIPSSTSNQLMYRIGMTHLF
ncbi:porin [Burkholderia multivorans]|uniref:porin n=1 Tax=Burkholderia multivorans TaxID=87883 RepID=UPI0021BFAA40|nr:porin [Burkholderia multivorans]